MHGLEWLMVAVFVAGYLAIALEHFIKLNKAASAILTGVICWIIYSVASADRVAMEGHLLEHLGDIASILFFLLGAMTIVTIVDMHDGFTVITNRVRTTSKSKLLWILTILAFFLSSLLDNLTTTIVMISLINRILTEKKDKWFFSGFMVIAANAGGAFSPIGDVTTTMLWIGGQITAWSIIEKTFLASLAVVLVPLVIAGLQFRGQHFAPVAPREENEMVVSYKNARIVLIAGVLSLVAVPFFKQATHLPPLMGMLFSLGFMWVLTTYMHRNQAQDFQKRFSITRALEIVDTPTILFFLGILLAISALQSHGLLNELATWVNTVIPDIKVIAFAMGILSAVIDNVPLVAALQGMYSLETFPQGHEFWEAIALTCGTGGSIIIIGSAAGVAAMGIQSIDFFWYLMKIGWLALVGFVAGNLVFWLQHAITG